MKMRSTASLLAASIIVAASGTASATNISYSNPFPSSHTIQTTSMEPFAKAIEESSNGSLRLTIHSGGVMASGPATLSAIQRSTVDAGLVVSAWVTSQLPATDTAAQFTIAASDPRVAAAAANEFYLLRCPECLEENKKVNARPLAYYASSTYHFICRRPIDSLDELAGKRVRATSAPLVNWVEQFNSTVVAVPTADIYQAMQRGQTDCTVGPLAYFRSLNLQEVAEWASDMPFGSYYGATIMTMNTRAWDRLDEAQQTAITDNLAAMVRNATEGYIKDGENARATALEAGVIFAEPREQDVKKLESHIEREFERVVGVARERGVGGDDPEGFVKSFMETLEKWESIVSELGDDFDAYEQALHEEIFSKL
ncbi:MAG: C4-dicarboxylate TRAP transporter substrate-binding protein [Ectothiorhodospiraceae bacterium]|nr:C4-dicarboxylate TRAP transporter substrate-binding protein [Ectothiorhodospiraceae bacterium]MCH8505496.1 C4-dicarboxylate TRAP transporter substrate-binding protein [Ectothiorhodospiraceae bacterium]